MDSDRRKARVKRLKREILAFIGLMIVVPWVIVVILSVKNRKMNAANSQKDVLIGQYIEQLEYLSGLEQAEANEAEAEVLTPEISKGTYDNLSEEEIDRLRLSDEELYDGYRKVYLTFDDGPSDNTAAILDILKEYNVKATFFVIYKEGRENEELYRRIVDEGHTLGMHSCTHVYSKVYKSEEAFSEDTDTIRDFLYMVTGVKSNFYRFPGGSSNRASDIDMKVFGRILEDKGITYFDWNMASGDAHSPILSKDKIVYNSTATLHEFSTPVILFHDSNSKTTTVEALPEIIEFIQSMDNTVILPITEETKPIQHVSVD